MSNETGMTVLNPKGDLRLIVAETQEHVITKTSELRGITGCC